MAVLVGPGAGVEVRRMSRFACVGLLGVVVNMVLLWALTERAHLYYVVSSVIATEVAIVTNFILHHTWTFAALSDGERMLAKLAKYNALALGGLLLTVGSLFLLTGLLRLPYLVANPVAIGAGTTWNYLASRQWAWRPSAPPPVA